MIVLSAGCGVGFGVEYAATPVDASPKEEPVLIYEFGVEPFGDAVDSSTSTVALLPSSSSHMQLRPLFSQANMRAGEGSSFGKLEFDTDGTFKYSFCDARGAKICEFEAAKHRRGSP